jgi:hypothetical protein
MGQVNTRKLRILAALCGSLMLLLPQNAQAISKCGTAALAEWLVPGLGYLIIEDYDKAVVFGGLRWWSLTGATTNMMDDDYQSDPDEIYKVTDTGSDETRTDVYLTRETFYGNAYARFYTNMTFITFYDLYDGGCQDNTETYAEIFSPFQFWEFGDSLTFWIPTGLQLATAGTPNLTYHVDSDLNREEMQRISFVNNQLTGVGEEMFFRGFLQRSIYRGLNDGFSKPTARWGSILIASSLFAVAHNGAGFSAGPGAAFAAGIYLGTVYHPSSGEFNLTEAIAIHSWWNSLIGYKNLRDADFEERAPGENAKNATLASNRYQPLFGFTYRF